MVALPVDFSAISGTINGSSFASNFDALNAKFGQITSADISSAAGILSTQLSERYAIENVVTQLVPHGSTAATFTGTPGVFTIDVDTPARVFRRRIHARSGQLVWLCLLEVYVDVKNTVGGSNPTVVAYKNGTAIPGATFTLDTSNDFYIFARSDPLANPLIAFVDNDVIEFRLGASAAGDATCAGIQVHEMWKRPLGV